MRCVHHGRLFPICACSHGTKRYVPEPGPAWVGIITRPNTRNTTLVAQMMPAEESPSPLRAWTPLWWHRRHTEQLEHRFLLGSRHHTPVTGHQPSVDLAALATPDAL